MLGIDRRFVLKEVVLRNDAAERDDPPEHKPSSSSRMINALTSPPPYTDVASILIILAVQLAVWRE